MENISTTRKWWALIGLCLLAFTGFLDYTVVNTALPAMQSALHASILQLQWVINIFSLVNSMFMITAGRVADIFGRRKVFYIGMIIFGLSALGAGLSSTIHWVVFFRGCQSVGTSILFTSALALVCNLFPGQGQAKAIGVYAGFTGVGLAIGPLVGGVLVTLLSWRWVFFINLPFIVIGLFISWLSLPNFPRPNKKPTIDFYGFFLLSITIGSLVYAIIHGEQLGWLDPVTLLFFVISIVALPLLIYVESRVKDPVLDLEIFKNKPIMLVVMTCVSSSVVTYVILFFNPLYLSVIRGQSAFYLGLMLAAIPAMQVVVSVFYDRLSRGFSAAQLSLVAMCATLIAVVIQLFFSSTISFVIIIISYLFCGVAWGFCNTLTPSIVNRVMPAEKAGASIGTIFTMWNISGAIILAIAAVVFHSHEARSMNGLMEKSQLHLTKFDYKLVRSALADPEHVLKHLYQLLGQKGELLIGYFKQAFMSGFVTMMWVMLAVAVISLLVGFVLFKMGEKGEPAE